MTIPPDLEAQILRYYHVEKWRIGTIARQLRVHPETVARVLAQAGLPRIGTPRRPSKIDPYLPFIREMLAKFPTLTASRLHAMAWERGYRGGPSRFRAIIACHRPRPTAEASAFSRYSMGAARAPLLNGIPRTCCRAAMWSGFPATRKRAKVCRAASRALRVVMLF